MILFWGALIPAATSLLGGLFGGSKTKQVDPNVWGMSSGQRSGLATSAYNQQQGQYGSDPGAFWGGRPAWTTSDLGVGNGRLLDSLLGPGGGGFGGVGGGVSAQGYSPSFGSAHLAQAFSANPELVDLSAGIYQLDMPEDLSTKMGGRIARRTNAQAADAQRGIMDRARLSGFGGDISSPWLQALQANVDRHRLAAIAEANLTGELEWAMPAAERQHGARGLNAQLGTQTNLQNAGRQTDVSMFNAGEQNQMGMFNAGAANQAAAFGASSRQSAAAANQAAALQQAGMGQAGAEFLMRLRAADEDRMLQRYGMQHNMNMDWQRPQAQTQTLQQPGWFQNAMGGLGAGLQLYGGLKDYGLFGGNKGKAGGGIYTTPQGYAANS